MTFRERERERKGERERKREPKNGDSIERKINNNNKDLCKGMY